RRGPGRRSPSRTASKTGRYVRSTPERRNNDLAFDATIRAAAPHQRKRFRPGVSIAIEEEDIREKVRERKIGNLLLFIVDASGSMGTTLMTETKGAIMSLLLDAYQKRDKVGFVAFRETKAEVLLPPTDSIELAKKLLEDLPTGGKTPLSEGILTGYEMTLQQLRKDPNIVPLMVVISDCRANVPLSESRRIKQSPPGKGFAYVVSEVFEVAQKIRQDIRIRTILIDVNEELAPVQLSMKLADALGAQYFRLEDLRAHGILRVIESHRNLET
ncbi:MAG: VWA domain-containing protein, partial [Candidatus Tectomicrobia bacterium]|nr:VWA domain-containing protein [Candidatus Tectomicrobia bacterium]